MRKAFVASIAIVVGVAICPGLLVGQEAGRRFLSPTTVVKKGSALEHWEVDGWRRAVRYSTEASSRSDGVVLSIQSDSLTRGRYFRQVPLTPRSDYRLTYWIKTEHVAGRGPGAGAGVRLGSFEFTPDTTYRGSNDWTYCEVTFSTDDDDSMVLEFLLGKNGPAKGVVMIDEIYLERVATTPLDPSITIDLSQRGDTLSKYIYGQFIEHMGNSIYGGIWAEMLEDRKFFYVPNTNKSPWNVNDSAHLLIDSLDAFVGEYSPMLKASTDASVQFYQEGIALEARRRYGGRIVISSEPSAMPIDVVLSWGEGPSQRDVVRITESSRRYQEYPIAFQSEGGTKEGRLAIIPRGEGIVQIGTLSLMPANNIDGFRPDVIALMKALKAPVYRWPGGNFVSGYNWKDGVGARDKRPPRVDRAWESDYEQVWNAVESNDVGIHEFMKLCEILDAEPYVAVNTGLGTAKLAAEEVEYLNGEVDTPMGKWRAQNGHPEPFDVRFFAVGNEMYGSWQLGNIPVEQYVKKHNRVAEAMWNVDPDIDLVAVGNSGEWNKQMYTHSADYMTYISEHFYRQNWHGGGLMTHVKQMPDAIKAIADEHRRWRRELDVLDHKDIKIALDEWNYWYGPHVYGLLGTRYFLRDALGIAAGINEYMRNSDIYFMANYAQTVNVIGAIKATKTDAFLAATGEVLKTYRDKFGYIPVETYGDELPFDIAAALTRDGQYLTISVVNPTKEAQELEMKTVEGDIRNKGTAYTITGESDMAYNEVDNKDAVDTHVGAIEIRNHTVKLPAISASILKFKIID